MGHTTACESRHYDEATGMWGACNCGFNDALQAEQDALAAQAQSEQEQAAQDQYVAEMYRDMGEGGE